jgi:hypothetical protein
MSRLFKRLQQLITMHISYYVQMFTYCQYQIFTFLCRTVAAVSYPSPRPIFRVATSLWVFFTMKKRQFYFLTSGALFTGLGRDRGCDQQLQGGPFRSRG